MVFALYLYYHHYHHIINHESPCYIPCYIHVIYTTLPSTTIRTDFLYYVSNCAYIFSIVNVLICLIKY